MSEEKKYPKLTAQTRIEVSPTFEMLEEKLISLKKDIEKKLMSQLRPLECVNCGAPLERNSLQCEYCGTAYAAEGAREDTVTLYADGAELAKAIKRIDIKRLELVKDPIYPLAYISAHNQSWKNNGGNGI